MSQQEPKRGSDLQVILFITTLSVICALILSVLASVLEQPKEIAKELDRSEQMMIAARIYSHNGYFLLPGKEGEYEPAKLQDGVLIPGNKEDIASKAEILAIYQNRLAPRFLTEQGELKTAEELGINLADYTKNYRKSGYYLQPNKLLYLILPNEKPAEAKEAKPIGYVIPVNGYGLWDAIYGYIAIEPDGETVIGISWYDQKETPGLGANIADFEWQYQFEEKKIFQLGSDGKANLKVAPVGITVVKGKVQEVYGDSPKAKSAVDGMAGATLTGNGVTTAYREVLNAYRPLFIKLNETKS